jgi:hypothetical protein
MGFHMRKNRHGLSLEIFGKMTGRWRGLRENTKGWAGLFGFRNSFIISWQVENNAVVTVFVC